MIGVHADTREPGQDRRLGKREARPEQDRTLDQPRGEGRLGLQPKAFVKGGEARAHRPDTSDRGGSAGPADHLR
jgi:hypothetical protein